MRLILHSSSVYIFGAIILIGIAIVMLVSLVRENGEERITATVERGDVTELVSVSGVVEADNTAHLAFPVTGIASDVQVNEGEFVEAGEILATLQQNDLLADRKDALAALSSARADRAELISGPRSEAREVTSATVAIKESELRQVEAEERRKVDNARRTLLSTDLEAVAENPNEDAEPPTVSGTYTCEEEGEYELSVYSSSAPSDYSFQLSGLESGTYAASIEQPSRFGTCGLRLQFDADSTYSYSTWTIAVPNTQSSSYISNLNAYELAVEQAKNRIADAREALELARRQQTLENAAPRSEAMMRADAVVTQAQARLERVNAAIADRTLRAPFAGTVTDVEILPGETVGLEPVITLLADDEFKLTARVPEIDITKLETGQRAYVVFDARQSETLEGTVDFISPLALEIDGVAYFESTIGFPETPPWLRSGLNADIDIVVGQVEQVLRLPQRFVESDDDTHTVYLHEGEKVVPHTVELGFTGNDGFVEIIGLDAGTEVVAP